MKKFLGLGIKDQRPPDPLLYLLMLNIIFHSFPQVQNPVLHTTQLLTSNLMSEMHTVKPVGNHHGLVESRSSSLSKALHEYRSK